MESHRISNLVSPIEEVIADAKDGKMFILVDQEDREKRQRGAATTQERKYETRG